jgi:hypothetical protein
VPDRLIDSSVSSLEITRTPKRRRGITDGEHENLRTPIPSRKCTNSTVRPTR